VPRAQVDAGEKDGALIVQRLRKALERRGLVFGTDGERVPIAAEKPEQVAYRRKYIRKRMDDRIEGALETAEITRVGELLAEGVDAPRNKGVLKELRKMGRGFKRRWSSLDESYVCENYVGEGTLHLPGDAINRR